MSGHGVIVFSSVGKLPAFVKLGSVITAVASKLILLFPGGSGGDVRMALGFWFASVTQSLMTWNVVLQTASVKVLPGDAAIESDSDHLNVST